MKLRILLCALFILGWGIETVLAQGLGRLRDRAVEAAARRVEQRVEQRLAHEIDQMVYRAVDRAFESAFGAPHNRSDFATDTEYEAAMQEWRMAMIMMGADAKIRDAYSFSLHSKMRVEATDPDGNPEEPATYLNWFEPGKGYSATTIPGDDEHQVTMVTDFENESVIMFIDGEDGKMSFVYSTQALRSALTAAAADEDALYDEADENGHPSMQSIGQKSILGLTADGYRVEDENGITEFWVTRELELEHIASTNTSGVHQQAFAGILLPGDGFILLMTHKSHINRETFRMETIEINRDVDNVYSLNEYPRIAY